jgi:hypothetical protein
MADDPHAAIQHGNLQALRPDVGADDHAGSAVLSEAGIVSSMPAPVP